MQSTIISSFSVNSQEELICAFEYMLPGLIWDEHNVVFMSRIKDSVYAYHYIHDDNVETRELFAIYDFFQKKGINLKETPINIVPSPFFSRILFPPDDLGKPFYITKRPNNIAEKVLNLFCCKEQIMLNKNLSCIRDIKNIYLKKKQALPIPLYQPVDDSGYAWQLDANW